MIEAKISGIFPDPIYLAKLDRKFTKQELEVVEEMRTDELQNIGNTFSVNHDVLNHPSFTTLKKEVDLFIGDYFSKILLPPKTVVPYITQSWLNYTKPNEFHHTHNHVNTYLSGVLYINADKAHDKITFENIRYDQIQLPITAWNLFNSYDMSFAVESGDIIIFPSRLPHLVPPKEGKNTRVSISFNVFVKGILGQPGSLSELTL